ELDDLAHGLVARDDRQLQREHAAMHADVSAANPARTNANRDLTGGRLRVRHVANLPRRVELSDDECSHDSFLRLTPNFYDSWPSSAMPEAALLSPDPAIFANSPGELPPANLKSRVKCEVLSYPTRAAASPTRSCWPMRSSRAVSSRTCFKYGIGDTRATA